MSDFNVGDRVRRTSGASGIGTVTAVGKHNVLVMEGDVEDRWCKSLCDVLPPLPTPPEGREVEEMRPPKKGDMYWSDVAIPHKWQQAYDDHRFSGDKPRYCLRPLPPKPEGEGWEWRKPKQGDEYQSLTAIGAVPNVGGSVFVAGSNDEVATNVRLGYRWCRKKPKVLRWTRSTHGMEIPCIDDGTGPRLDIDKIGREWIRTKPMGMTVAQLIQQEASNVND